jgi:hypothetical protein
LKNKMLITAILIAVVGVGAFWAGMQYQNSKLPAKFNGQNMRAMKYGQGLPGQGQPEGMEAVRGEILSVNDNSLTVKLLDDSSKIVLISENTEINKASEASSSDLLTGEPVMIFGKTNSDGSISAAQIQLSFDFRGPSQFRE